MLKVLSKSAPSQRFFSSLSTTNFLKIVRYAKAAHDSHNDLNMHCYIDAAEKLYNKISLEEREKSLNIPEPKLMEFFYTKLNESRKDEEIVSSSAIKEMVKDLIQNAANTSEERRAERQYYFRKARRMLNNIPLEKFQEQDEQLLFNVILGQIDIFDGSESESKQLKKSLDSFKALYSDSKLVEILEEKLVNLFDGPPMSRPNPS